MVGDYIDALGFVIFPFVSCQLPVISCQPKKRIGLVELTVFAFLTGNWQLATDNSPI
jgi:hypothetical protein